MDKRSEFTKRLFDIIARLKHADIIGINNIDNDIRPSEEMFLIKIDMLAMGHDVKVNDLVNLLKFAPSTVSTILKALEDTGYIVREINKDNRREVFVKLTDKGKKRLEAAKKNHFNMVSDLMTYLGDEDANNLITILEKTTVFFEKRREDGRKKQ